MPLPFIIGGLAVAAKAVGATAAIIGTKVAATAAAVAATSVATKIVAGVAVIALASTINQRLTIDRLKDALSEAKDEKLQNKLMRAKSAKIKSILDRGDYKAVNVGLYDYDDEHLIDWEIKANAGIDTSQIYVGRIIPAYELVS